MEPSTRLDYILFQLTPTRTRCDLVIFSGKRNEKLAYGLLDPFISHLRSAKDQIAKGGYSVTLRPPASYGSATWFTKLTVLRFVRFVSSPEVIERVVTIEREIQQIENSIHTYEASNAEAADGNSKSANYSKNKLESSGSIDGEEQETSKDRLQRVLDSRKAVLRKEQAMAYARALAAGYEIENLDDLLAFSDAFGASRLREACVNFIDLWKKKNQDRLWMDEIAAMQASIQPQLSYVATPGIVLTGDEDPDQTTGSGGSSETAPGPVKSNDGKHQMPMPWTNQIPPYMNNFQGPMYQQVPSYQGYGYPGMPPYFPGHMQWPHNMRDAAHGSDRELDDTRSYRSSRKKERKPKARQESEKDDDETEPSDSSGESESSQEQRSRKRHGKKSSRKVVIRNINYITSKKNGRSSEETASDEEGLDDDSIREQVEEAVGSLGKHHKTTRRRRKDVKNDDFSEQDMKSEFHKNDEGIRGNGNWDALQDLLMREDTTNESRSVQIEEQTSFASKQHEEGNMIQKPMEPDAFLPSERETGDGSSFSRVAFENVESGGRARKGAAGEEFLISDRDVASDYYSRAMPSDYGSSSVIKGRDSDDWITGKTSDRAGNFEANIDVGMLDGEYAVSSNGRTEHSKKELFDDSIMIQPVMVDDRYLPSFDSDIVADIAGAPTPGEGKDTKEPVDIYEPEELYMGLDRDNLGDHVMSSWSVDMNLEESIPLNEAQNKKPPVGAGAEAKLQSGKGLKKTPTRDARSRSLNGPLGRSKTDLTERNRRSTFGSKTGLPRGGLKDEENRKRMEEVALERKRRIAERSSARGQSAASSKVNPTLTRARSASVTERSKAPSSTEEPARATKSVLRSSTIERLATAKTYKQEDSRTQTKATLPKKVVGANVNKTKPLEKKSGSEKLNKAIDVPSVSVPDNNLGKASFSTSHPTDMTTQQSMVAPDATYPTEEIKNASEDVKELHIAPSISIVEEKPLEQKGLVEERSYTIDYKSKSPEDNQVVSTLKPKEEIELKQNVAALSKAKPQPIFEPVQGSPIKQVVSNSPPEENGGSTKEIIPEVSTELPKIKSSTPPSIHEMGADPINSLRKKWNDAATDSPKSAKGFRKLLMFSRRKVEMA